VGGERAGTLRGAYQVLVKADENKRRGWQGVNCYRKKSLRGGRKKKWERATNRVPGLGLYNVGRKSWSGNESVDKNKFKKNLCQRRELLLGWSQRGAWGGPEFLALMVRRGVRAEKWSRKKGVELVACWGNVPRIILLAEKLWIFRKKKTHMACSKVGEGKNVTLSLRRGLGTLIFNLRIEGDNTRRGGRRTSGYSGRRKREDKIGSKRPMLSGKTYGVLGPG